jgi:hypothetical protein
MAITSAEGVTVSRAMMYEPIAAWTDVVLLAGMRLRSSANVAHLVCLVAMHHHRERVDRIAGEQHVELDQVRRPHPAQLVVQRGAARAGLQAVEEVEHDFGQRRAKVICPLRARSRHRRARRAPLLRSP